MFTGPNIVTDGLVLYLDAANPKSYPGAGTVWNDLSNQGNGGTLTNGPTFDSSNNGSIQFDGVDDYVTLGNLTFLNGAVNASWGFWAKISATANQMPITQWNGSTSNFFYVYFNGSDVIRVAMGGSFVYTSPIISGLNGLDTWRYYVVTFDGSLSPATERVKLYINTTLQDNFNNGPTALGTATSNFNIGRREAAGGQFYFNGDVAIAKIYNRTLTQSEISQNYNATKSRFGL